MESHLLFYVLTWFLCPFVDFGELILCARFDLSSLVAFFRQTFSRDILSYSAFFGFVSIFARRLSGPFRLCFCSELPLFFFWAGIEFHRPPFFGRIFLDVWVVNFPHDFPASCFIDVWSSFFERYFVDIFSTFFFEWMSVSNKCDLTRTYAFATLP